MPRNPLGARVVPLALLALTAAFGFGVWLADASSKSATAVAAMIFLVGPVLVVLDRIKQNALSLGWHHAETAARVAVLLGLFALLPTGINTIMGNLSNFFCVYLCAWLGLQQFVIRPQHWLRHDNKGHTAFLAIMVAAVGLDIGLHSVQKGLGSALLAACTIAVVIAWRHALWFNAHRELSPGQHADVWHSLAKRYPNPEDFWKMFNRYVFSNYPTQPALSVMGLPLLLDFFKHEAWHIVPIRPPAQLPHTANENPQYRALRDDIKATINAKEPRATFVWQLYPEAEAVDIIARIDEFEANAQAEVLELPTL